MTILRSGSTKKYSDNWSKAFGSGAKKKSAAKSTKKQTKATKKKSKSKKK